MSVQLMNAAACFDMSPFTFKFAIAFSNFFYHLYSIECVLGKIEHVPRYLLLFIHESKVARATGARPPFYGFAIILRPDATLTGPTRPSMLYPVATAVKDSHRPSWLRQKIRWVEGGSSL
jgi:hypothetical protein